MPTKIEIQISIKDAAPRVLELVTHAATAREVETCYEKDLDGIKRELTNIR